MMSLGLDNEGRDGWESRNRGWQRMIGGEGERVLSTDDGGR